MKKEQTTSEQIEECIKSQKAAFRQYQRDLPFGEKMQIAFSLAERDKAVRRAVQLSKRKRKINNLPI